MLVCHGRETLKFYLFLSITTESMQRGLEALIQADINSNSLLEAVKGTMLKAGIWSYMKRTYEEVKEESQQGFEKATELWRPADNEVGFIRRSIMSLTTSSTIPVLEPVSYSSPVTEKKSVLYRNRDAWVLIHPLNYLCLQCSVI